jgi:hypothetical protein
VLRSPKHLELRRGLAGAVVLGRSEVACKGSFVWPAARRPAQGSELSLDNGLNEGNVVCSFVLHAISSVRL